ncbi:MAG: hypothetical protein E6G34_08185 [Actinobacteria bacterium]|nr:MAG: hypothetical protein E6G34_08185 [Actinomycetota bacterium]
MPPTARAPHQRDSRRGLRALIPQRALVASLPFSATLRAGEVGAAIAAGLRAGGCADADVLALGDDPHGAPGGPSAELEAPGTALELAGFDERLRRARALILAAARLERGRLRGTLELEILTRARQAGVPAYAMCRDLRLDAFDARLLDLQVAIEARTERSLTAAARRLAPLL